MIKLITHNFKPLILTTILLSLAGCDKKPTPEPVNQTTAANTTTAPIPKARPLPPFAAFKGNVRPVNIANESCKPVCPTVAIERLQSNYPTLDSLIDEFIYNYTEELLNGYDLPDSSSLDRALQQPDTAPNDKKDDKNSQNAKHTARNQSTNAVSANNIPIDSKQPTTAILADSRAASVSTATSQDDSQQTLSIRLLPFIQKLNAIAAENKSYGNTSTLVLTIRPTIIAPLSSRPQLMTIMIDSENYLGGAHGSHHKRYINFDLKTNTQLNLEQVILEGKRKDFNDLAYQKFVQWVKESQPDSDIKDYENLWAFNVTDNFYFAPEGLILHYAEYEIGPYAVGMPRLILPYAQLKGIIQPSYLPSGKNVAAQ